MSERIWFLTQRNDIIDLNTAQYFFMKHIKDDCFVVCMDCKESMYTLAEFEKKCYAIEYLNEIYAVLRTPGWKISNAFKNLE